MAKCRMPKQPDTTIRRRHPVAKARRTDLRAPEDRADPGQLVAELSAGWRGRGQRGDGADIRAVVALPLPLQVICQLLGVTVRGPRAVP
jgi:cytochrome P450